ncbi:MAG: family 20 glycosylhydrolase, partial [Candidatus Heimdallarchaeota archaeon]|nr:family 20 glycosylhydrolase [Candidatus Heimdallarchaeota archaeon]
DEACTIHWEKCPLCSKQLKSLKLKDFHQYQKYFMKKINDYTSQQVSENIEWADHLELNIPKQQIIQTWHKGEAEKALEAGHRIICSEHEFVYFDYPQGDDELHLDFMLSLDIETVYKFESIPTGTKNLDLVLGGEACIWTEDIPEDKVFSKTFPRLFAVAETLWSDPKDRNFIEFSSRVDTLCRRFDILGLDYYRIK